MKILMVTPGRLPVPAVRGGAVENLIELLLDYNERYHLAEITVISMYDKNAVEKSLGYRNSKFYFFRRNIVFEMMMRRHVLPYRFFDYCYSWKAGKFLADCDAGYDVVVIENELVNGWMMKRFIRSAYIYHAHNDTLLEKRKKDVCFLEACDQVITVSDYLSDCYRQKAAAAQISTVYNGIDIHLFDRKAHWERGRELRKQYNIKPEETVVVFAGRLVSEKGIEVLLKAVNRIPEDQNIVLLIIGSSFFQKSAENAYVKRLKEISAPIKDRIIFSGYVDYEKMPDYYSMADIGCVPSLWQEPFGLTVVEQMSMELPVIAADTGAISEIMDTSCGYLLSVDSELSIKLADAIVELKNHPDKRQAMGMEGRRKVEAFFSREIFCKNWYRRVTGINAERTVL